MNNVILQKENINSLLNDLRKDITIIAPIEHDGRIEFTVIDSPEKIKQDILNSSTSPKKFLYPQGECIFQFHRAGREDISLADKQQENKQLLWKIRPCDAASFSYLDKNFGDDYQDEFYQQRRRNTILAGELCLKPGKTCFCNWFSISPTSKQELDIAITEIEEGYFVESLTERGTELLIHYKQYFSPAAGEVVEKVNQLHETTVSKLNSHTINENLASKLAELFADTDFWQEESFKCINCGICTFSCPTCFCFDLTDEALGPEGRRVRTWDSCMLPLFTRMATHQPRPEKYRRFRQRFMHKLSYSYQNNQGFGCVGCGRCISNCPVNVDIREIIHKVQEMQEGVKKSSG